MLVLTRDSASAMRKLRYPNVKVFQPADWKKAISGADAVVNLAGEPIATRCSLHHLSSSSSAPSCASPHSVSAVLSPVQLMSSVYALIYAYGLLPAAKACRTFVTLGHHCDLRPFKSAQHYFFLSVVHRWCRIRTAAILYKCMSCRRLEMRVGVQME